MIIGKQSSVLLIAMVISLGGIAQSDTLRWKKLRFDFTGGLYFQQGGSTEVKIPSYLASRRAMEPDVAHMWGLNWGGTPEASDNPMGHGGSYWRMHSWYDLSDNLQLYGSLTVDHRGYSFAAYNTDQIAFLARYHARYAKWFKLASDSLQFSFKVGTFEDYRIGEGLTIYNLDLQGYTAKLKWRHASIAINKIADLQFGVGLNCDGFDDYRLALEDLKLNPHWNLSLSAAMQDLFDSAFPRRMDILSGTFSLHHHATKIYGEIGYRFNNDYFTAKQSYAYVFGAKSEFKTPKLKASLTAEARYYTQGFNDQLRDETIVHYRKTDQLPGKNYIGEQVYPMSFLNRPFSQWAVFTEYNTKPWVAGTSLLTNLKYNLKGALYAFADLDLNMITSTDEDPFLYPFYGLGFRWETVKDTYLAVSVTNKTMNLDKHYTTYYLLKQPAFQIELRRDIKL